MCRLFAFSFAKETPYKNKYEWVTICKALAVTGAVLPQSTPGHADGWGLVMYPTRGSPVLYKSTESAHNDNVFEAPSFLSEATSETGLIHLRKKTVGEASLLNTHPFVEDTYSFIHNGTITQSDTLYTNLTQDCVGSTDSERLFRRFLEIKNNEMVTVKDAFIKMLTETKALHPEYSAINTILHDGSHIYVSRIINPHNPKYTFSDTENYYTLYTGTSTRGDTFVASEKIPFEGTTYTLLPNNSISVMTLSSGLIETHQLA